MDSEELGLLRKKLFLLEYPGSFDADSAPLIERLVDDLIHTTESYRDLKAQSDHQQTKIDTFSSKVSFQIWSQPSFGC